VFEEGNEIVIEVAATTAGSHQGLQDFQAYNDASLARAILGVSDAVDPGKNGSQAAVGTRAGAAMDPRMVTDGMMIADGFQQTLFRQLIEMNPHRWPVPVSEVPTPIMRLRTADDEVRRDHSDLEAELSALGTPTDLRASDGPEPAAQSVDSTAMNGAQTQGALEIATAANTGAISRDQAVALLSVAFPTMSSAEAARIAGAGQPVEPPVPTPEAAPAVPATRKPRKRKDAQ